MNRMMKPIKTDKIYLSIFMSGRCLPTQMSSTQPVGIFYLGENRSSNAA